MFQLPPNVLWLIFIKYVPSDVFLRLPKGDRFYKNIFLCCSRNGIDSMCNGPNNQNQQSLAASLEMISFRSFTVFEV